MHSGNGSKDKGKKLGSTVLAWAAVNGGLDHGDGDRHGDNR